jgi:hypothetical protein
MPEHAEWIAPAKYGILIHALELELWALSGFWRSHAFAKFSHQIFYGCAGYVDDPLPDIVHIAILDVCLHCVALLCNYVVVFGQFFSA